MSIRQSVATLHGVEKALEEQRYEEARRLCRHALRHCDESERGAYLRLLHKAMRQLGDFVGASEVLHEIKASSQNEQIELLLLRAEDYALLANDSFYRESEERRAGLTVDEYLDKMRATALEPLEAAVAAGLNGCLPRAAQLFRKLGEEEKARALQADNSVVDKTSPEPVSAASPARPSGSLAGTLSFSDGTPVADAQVTLGLAFFVMAADPASYNKTGMGYAPTMGRQEAVTTHTDANGGYYFDAVPAGHHEFLAVTLDDARHDINTHFVAHGVDIQVGEETRCDATIREWQSSRPHVVENPFNEEKEWQGSRLHQLHTETWHNPFYFTFPRQLVEWEIAGRELDARYLVLFDSRQPEQPVPIQVAGNSVLFFADLPELTDCAFALYEAQQPLALSTPESRLHFREEGSSCVVVTGRAKFRFAWGTQTNSQAPLLQVCGEDGTWRGEGRWVLPSGVHILRHTSKLLEVGALRLRLEITYELSDGQNWSFEFTAHEGEAYLLCHEKTPPLENAAFEFSLREFAEHPDGGRGYLHWMPEHGNRHWSSLKNQDKELARLQESVAWWIPPCGFGYAFTPDTLEEKDYISVFTIRRGDWKDIYFERLANGPINADGTPNPELDWPFPEMVGSTVSMITAHTDKSGDAFFRWVAFEGERHWGLLVSTLEDNQGVHKEISRVQHKNSSPRLQEFRLWRLDETDSELRPHVVTRREKLPGLRRKRESAIFAPYWRSLLESVTSDKNGASTAGIVFAVEGDPLLAWRKKCELVSVAQVRSKMTLLGRDYSDMYSPVGARPITYWAEDYDLIAASGVFTPEEERLVRSFLMLMGHMYLSPDLMNWRYGSRNANFEADRVDVVGAIGLCFHGNPDAEIFVQHAVELMERSLNVYCTPGSGKWYENPACYYLQASKCRGNLAFHLWRHGIYDASKLPRFKEFLRWGILLLTPPRPADYAIMRDGCSETEYEHVAKRRVIPPLGDHAELGRFIPEHYAFLSQLYRVHDPEFADELLWAYQTGGKPGTHFGNVPVLFASLEEDDLRPRPAPALGSRRLQGFGAVLRDAFETPDELHVLWKQGPGGYRYQRSEGSFMLFAGGKPLVYEGGEAGETWRHSTLSFHDVHTPLAPGRVERFQAFPNFDFVQGIHPKILEPGEPVYLSDDCNHHLVEEAYRRYAKPNPAVVRSQWRVGQDYLVIHDDLSQAPKLQAHWHLHAVADRESFDAEYGYIFQGRFGIDLQVLLPGQNFEAEQLSSLPLHEYQGPIAERFTTRHLQLTRTGANGFLGLLRPLKKNQKPLSARLLGEANTMSGLQVEGEGIQDTLWFSHAGATYDQAPDLIFEGRYGVVRRRLDALYLTLIDGRCLETSEVSINSEGPSVWVRSTRTGVSIQAEGHGFFRVRIGAREWSATLTGEKIEHEW